MVPADLPTLARLLGGPQQAVVRLDRLFEKLNAGPTSPYYWAGNEPGLATPWAYDFFGRPDRTIAVVHRLMSDLYGDTRAGLPGNDDLGALSSWYVWAALGMYPEIPGQAGLALGAPLFPAITVHYGAGRTLRLLARSPGSLLHGRPAVYLDGNRLSGSWLSLSALGPHSVLLFGLAGSPSASR
jgi:putative alpha-1,2-mannosidase